MATRTKMSELNIASSVDSVNQSTPICTYISSVIAILLGISCLTGFALTAVKGTLSSSLVDECKNGTQTVAFCFLRSIMTDAFNTQWNQYIVVSLLLIYASIFFHIIIESSRTNVSSLLGKMFLQTMCLIVGIGVCFPILFIPSYVYFYTFKRNVNKSPVLLNIVCIGFIYVVSIIIVPTYLIFFLSSHKEMASILSIILLISPLGFAPVSFPILLCSESIQRFWFINSHRLIAYAQIILFCLSTPLFFYVFVSLNMHWSADLIHKSYVTEMSNMIDSVPIIWSIDYVSLLIGLILFIIINERTSHNISYRSSLSKTKKLIGYFIFIVLFPIAPCLIIPLYFAWNEFQAIQPTETRF